MTSKAEEGAPDGSTGVLSRMDIQNYYDREVKDNLQATRDKGRMYVYTFVVEYLSNLEHSKKLSRQFADIFDKSVRDNSEWEPEEAVIAFKAIERYALNLLDMPWKTEYKFLKMYAGFYQVRIQPFLQQAADIFKMMGYEEIKPQILGLKRPVNVQHLAFIACECFIAQVECNLMKNIIDKTSYTHYTMLDVYRSRLEVVGGVVKCVNWLRENCQPIEMPEIDTEPETLKRLRDQKKLINPKVPTENEHRDANFLSSFSAKPKSPIGLRHKTAVESVYPAGQTLVDIVGHADLSQSNVAELVGIPPDSLYEQHSMRTDKAAAMSVTSDDIDIFEAGTIEDHQRKSMQVMEKKGHPSPKKNRVHPESGSSDWRHVTSALHRDKAYSAEYGNRGVQVQFMADVHQPFSRGQEPEEYENLQNEYTQIGRPGASLQAGHRDLVTSATPPPPPTDLRVSTKQAINDNNSDDLPREFPSPICDDPSVGTGNISVGRINLSDPGEDSGIPQRRVGLLQMPDYAATTQPIYEEPHQPFKRSTPDRNSFYDNVHLQTDSAPVDMIEPYASVTAQRRTGFIRSRGVHRASADDILMASKPSTPLNRYHSASTGYATSLEVADSSEWPDNLSVTSSSTNPPDLPETYIKWQCEACTYVNRSDSNICEICGKSRVRTQEPGLTSGGPQCPDCTFVNHIGSDFCELCHANLHGSATYI